MKVQAKLINDIHNRLKIANHYFQEHKEILKQRDNDNGKIYREYFLSIPFIQKSYLDQYLLILCTLFEKNGSITFSRLRTSIKNNKCQRFDEFFTDFHRISKGIKLIRNKSIAHLDNENIDIIFEKANITYNDIQELLEKSLDYLKYLSSSLSVTLEKELTYPYNNKFGINQIYAKLA